MHRQQWGKIKLFNDVYVIKISEITILYNYNLNPFFHIIIKLLHIYTVRLKATNLTDYTVITAVLKNQQNDILKSRRIIYHLTAEVTFWSGTEFYMAESTGITSLLGCTRYNSFIQMYRTIPFDINTLHRTPRQTSVFNPHSEMFAKQQ